MRVQSAERAGQGHRGHQPRREKRVLQNQGPAHRRIRTQPHHSLPPRRAARVHGELHTRAHERRRHRRARDAPRAVRRVRGRGLRHRVAAVHRLHLGLAHLAPARPVHGGAVHQGRRPHAARRAGDDFGLAPRAARHMGGERRAVRRRTDGGRDHPLGRAVRRVRRADAQPRRTGGGQRGRRGGAARVGLHQEYHSRKNENQARHRRHLPVAAAVQRVPLLSAGGRRQPPRLLALLAEKCIETFF